MVRVACGERAEGQSRSVVWAETVIQASGLPLAAAADPFLAGCNACGGDPG
jgi:hypothetical protein